MLDRKPGPGTPSSQICLQRTPRRQPGAAPRSYCRDLAIAPSPYRHGRKALPGTNQLLCGGSRGPAVLLLAALIAVSAGLITSTLLSLAVVPTVFVHIHDVETWLARRVKSPCAVDSSTNDMTPARASLVVGGRHP